jgi:hypothetical protein
MAIQSYTPQYQNGLVRAAASVQKPDRTDVINSVLNFFGSSGPIQSSITGLDQSITAFGNTINGVNLQGQINEDVYRRIKTQYANLYIGLGVDTVGSTLQGITGDISQTTNAAATQINEALKPVSSFIGSTLGTLTGIMADPIGGTLNLPNTIGYMMDRVNPSLKAKYTATYAKYNIDKLAEMPGQLFGSAQQLVRSVDKITSLPIGIINDIYKGYTQLIGQMNDFINSLFEILQTFFNSILDSLFPGLTQFLTQLTEFANQIGGIAQIFGAQTQVLGFTNQIIQGANQLNSFIQNPLDLAFAYAPEQLSQGLYALQNPQALINQYLPPELSQYFAQISSITGFGFNGNMGYGLQSVLQGFQNGVLSGILQGFATQFSILAPLFTGQSIASSSYTNEAGTRTTQGIAYNVDKTGGQVIAGTPSPVYGRVA